MNQVVTFTELTLDGKSGTNKRGPFHFRVFKTSGGTRFQTFDVGLGDKILASYGQPLEVEYEVESNGQYENNVIKTIRLLDRAEASTAQPEPQQNRSDFQRSKEEVRRTESVKAAATIIVSDKWEGGSEPSDLFALADQIAVYAEHGAEAFVTADSDVPF